jgi:hypothetical protein
MGSTHHHLCPQVQSRCESTLQAILAAAAILQQLSRETKEGNVVNMITDNQRSDFALMSLEYFTDQHPIFAWCACFDLLRMIMATRPSLAFTQAILTLLDGKTWSVSVILEIDWR